MFLYQQSLMNPSLRAFSPQARPKSKSIRSFKTYFLTYSVIIPTVSLYKLLVYLCLCGI